MKDKILIVLVVILTIAVIGLGLFTYKIYDEMNENKTVVDKVDGDTSDLDSKDENNKVVVLF